MRYGYGFAVCLLVGCGAGESESRGETNTTHPLLTSGASTSATETASETASETGTHGGSETEGNTDGFGSTSETSETTETTNTTLKFDVGMDDDSDSDGDTTGPDDSMCPCAPNSDLIYVLSDSLELWTYNPLNNLFVLVGPLGCPTPNSTFSMGVGRNGYAWVQDTALDGFSTYIGDLFELDVNNPQNCTDPGYSPGANGWQHFGMAFVSQSADDPCDKLYGQHWDGNAGSWSEGPGHGKLGVFDEDAMQMNTIGATNYNGAELTGTGDGRIYAFGGVPTAKLIQFDKATAAEIETIPLGSLPLTQAFAFAFWGGDFYFFTEANSGIPGTTSKVTKLDYDGDMSLTTVNPGGPVRIVGAGVSTCAPVVPPG